MGLAALKIEDLPHYTYDDYAQWEGRWEIIEGVPYAMTPAPNLKHQHISQKIAAHLENLLKNRNYSYEKMSIFTESPRKNRYCSMSAHLG